MKQTFKKNTMNYSIKRRRQMKKCETSDLLMTHSLDDMIMSGETRSFRKIMFNIAFLSISVTNDEL